jgi:ubiquinone/menaquinone biosynthesis C-methylase UbiE
MKLFPDLRRIVEPLKFTPFHPQWYVYKNERKISGVIGRVTTGRVLDVGAGKQKIRQHLDESCRYVSLDYPQTATQWYQTRPQIFGDGQALPVPAQSMDTVLLLDVLEHLPRTGDCLAEVWRVLKPGGRFVLHVPFLYPLHDVPFDFYRWTEYGLKELAGECDFELEVVEREGHPIETAALLYNLAFSKTVLNWIQAKNPFLILVVFLPLLVLWINLTAWMIRAAAKADGFMPQGYLMVWKKSR